VCRAALEEFKKKIEKNRLKPAMAYNAAKLSKNPERERGKEGGRGARERA
jgi:hypothetical protein